MASLLSTDISKTIWICHNQTPTCLDATNGWPTTNQSIQAHGQVSTKVFTQGIPLFSLEFKWSIKE